MLKDVRLERFYEFCGSDDDTVSSWEFSKNMDDELKKYKAERFDWYTLDRCIIFEDGKYYNWFQLKWIDV
jgi:hypothetical protein